MQSIKSIKGMRKFIQTAKAKNKTIGFVPTMGALHEGHLSLARRSKKENDITVASVFINTKQFGPKEDFARYPREEKKDKLLVQREKVDVIFYPSAEEVYPHGYVTYVEVEEITQRLCGRFRPGHFRGVTTVVTKLLNIVKPNILYLGQKDTQQAIVLSKMVEDLNIPVKVQICPTVREKDGLAMSSRNVYLTAQQRQEAPVLFESLKNAQKKMIDGGRNVHSIAREVKSAIEKNSSAVVEYVECVNAATLRPLTKIQGNVLLALAVRFGKTRLIDNLMFKIL